MATETLAEEVARNKAAVENDVAAIDREVSAAFVASGIGAAVLGLAIVGAEISPAIKQALTLWGPVGPLSGKTTVSVVAFLLSWALLHVVFRNRQVQLRASFIVTLVLVSVGLLLSFPPVFEGIAHLLGA